MTRGQARIHHDVTIFPVRARAREKKQLSPIQALRAYITFKRDHLLYLTHEAPTGFTVESRLPPLPPTQPSTPLCSALPWTCALSQSTVESNGYRLLKGQKASLNCRGEGSQPWKSTVDGAQCLWLAVITVWWSPQLRN